MQCCDPRNAPHNEMSHINAVQHQMGIDSCDMDILSKLLNDCVLYNDVLFVCRSVDSRLVVFYVNMFSVVGLKQNCLMKIYGILVNELRFCE